mmetsp:Transcript_47165/g.145194  ORF Transcript_47165/g.145194 Transcript_47165/m.145194 type:complete len:207 (-) Transcript_47165:283-903(-)
MASAAESGKGAGRGSGGYGGFFGNLKDLTATVATQVASGAATLSSQAQERIETAHGGKKMLDAGGQPVENLLLAKKTANDAVILDRSVVAKLTDAAQIYEEAAQRMKACLTESAADSAATNEVSSFDRLAKDYEARAAALKVALETLNSVPQAPEISAVEQDAISILVAKGKYKWAVGKTSEGFNTLRRKSADAASSVTSSTACPP